jgi:hypothetical protein
VQSETVSPLTGRVNEPNPTSNVYFSPDGAVLPAVVEDGIALNCASHMEIKTGTVYGAWNFGAKLSFPLLMSTFCPDSSGSKYKSVNMNP